MLDDGHAVVNQRDYLLESGGGVFTWRIPLDRLLGSLQKSLELSLGFTAAHLPLESFLLAHFGGVNAQREEDGAHGVTNRVVSGDPVLSVRCSKVTVFVSL